MSSTIPQGLVSRINLDQSRLQMDGSSTYMGTPMAEARANTKDRFTDLPSRVLLVEPNPGEAARWRNELIASRFEVYVAQDQISAAHAVTIFQPNIIVSQLRLPTYGGLELLRRLKEDHSTRSTPVILYSDVASARERIEALEMGAVDVLTKPFVSDELIARVRAALKARHSVSLLERQAHRDGLTGLANRGVLDDQLVRQWDDCRRRQTALCVVIVDLDRFKAINDTYGHGAGDDVLRETAKVLAQSVRSSDLVARYGGEEFVVVAPSCSITEALELAKRFRARLADRKITVDGIVIKVTASVGIAAADFTQHGPAELLRHADEALYEAKHSGRDAIWLYDSSQKTPTVAVASGSRGGSEEIQPHE